MNILQNDFGGCSMFKATIRSVQQGLSRVWLSAVVALVCFNTALALVINQANEAELDSVKGMGPALNAKVLKARTQGLFKDWNDLVQHISGIRQNKATQFSEQGLTVNGQAFIAKPEM